MGIWSIVRADMAGFICGLAFMLSGLALITLVLVGVFRSAIASMAVECYLQVWEASHAIGKPAPGVEHKKRLLRVYAHAGLGGQAQWQRLGAELDDAANLGEHKVTNTDIQMLCDVFGRELDAVLQTLDAQERVKLLRECRHLAVKYREQSGGAE